MLRKPVHSATVLVIPGPRSSDGPEPPDSTPNDGPRRSATVLECVRDDMANRWMNHETSIITIRRKLNVSIPEAERVVRAGLRARGYGRKAA